MSSSLEESKSAFQDDNTIKSGSTFIVQVDFIFHQQINEASTLISKSRPENVRQSYINQFTTAASIASPPPPPSSEDDEEDQDEEPRSKKAIPDTPETLLAKRKVFKDLVASLKNLKIELGDKEFEGLTTLLVSLLLQLYPTTSEEISEEFSPLVLAIVDSFTLTQDKSTLPSLSSRYSALALVFNSLPSTLSSTKLSVLIKLIEFTASNDDLSVVEKPLQKLVSWLKEWNVHEEESNKAIKTVSEILISKGRKEDARSLLLDRLSTTTSTTDSTKSLQSTLLVLSLSSPTYFSFHSLPSLPSSSAALSSLLSSFLTPSSSPLDFPEELSSTFGLKKDEIERKLKLFKLAEICSEKVGGVVSYGEIAKAVGIEVGDGGEEVEIWVIDAIRATLISGRLSQPNQTFFITSALPRAFNEQHWDLLESRLQGWKKALGKIRESIPGGANTFVV